MKNKGHKIKAIDKGSIAEQLELKPGDYVMQINGFDIEDIFDYRYHVNSDSLVMIVKKADGEEWELDIENGYEDLGITFENGLMSEYKSCSNKCIFCFIDQMPPGMRDTLYFKDDDSRLSFLQGNYITLTNMSEHDIDRIIKFKLAPINISVHTTNPKLRCDMLQNRFAGDALKKIDTLYNAQIQMNSQIVLCKGVNDGKELENTIKDLSAYLPYMESLSVVPVGLSKFREGLYPLEPFDSEDAGKVIDIIEKWQKKCMKSHNTHFVHASDEFYLMAGRELPEERRYDGYKQLENGVGMLRLLNEEIKDALLHDVSMPADEELSIATGRLAYPYIKKYADIIAQKYPSKHIRVYTVTNNFFGEKITVAGLLTGQDIKNQLLGLELGKRLILPECMFRSGEEVFLDDMTKTELETALQVPVSIVKSSGYDFVECILNPDYQYDIPDYEGYEIRDGRKDT